MATKTKHTDFTVREPNLKQLHDQWCRERMAEDLNPGWGDSKAEQARARKFWTQQIKDTKYFRVVLKRDVTVQGRVVARKGDIAWAEYEPYFTGGILLPVGATKKQIESARQAHYVVRVLSPRKLATRPMYKGEPFHWNVCVSLKDATKI